MCKALRSLANGVEILEVGADKLYYQVGGQINVLFKQAEVVQLTQQPLRCDTIAQAL